MPAFIVCHRDGDGSGGDGGGGGGGRVSARWAFIVRESSKKHYVVTMRARARAPHIDLSSLILYGTSFLSLRLSLAFLSAFFAERHVSFICGFYPQSVEILSKKLIFFTIYCKFSTN